jgi:hypothetical protein
MRFRRPQGRRGRAVAVSELQQLVHADAASGHTECRCIQSFRLQVNRTPSDRCYKFVTALPGPFSVK